MIDSGFHDVLGQLRRALGESCFAELRQLRVDRRRDAFTLRGQVSSYYLKQVAQETLRAAARGVAVRNLTRVVPTSRP